MNPRPRPANGFALAFAALGALLACGSAAAEKHPPVILSHPASLILKSGSTAGFRVEVASDLPVSYQWTLNGSNLVDDPRVSSSTSPTLTVSNILRSDQYLYAVTVTNPDGKAESLPATLWVLEPPFFITQPRSQTVLTGSVVTLRAPAAGIEPLRYQWRRNGSNILGATESTLVLSNVAVSASGAYSAVAIDAIGTSVTRAATLIVATPPAITRQPSGTNVTLATPAVVFDVEAGGTQPRTYQWRLNGANIPGANGIARTNAPVELADGGSYDVVAANAVDAALSKPALLLFDDIPRGPEARDNLLDPAEPLFDAEGTVQGDNSFATREPGEPYHAHKPGGCSVWFTWIAPATGIATLSTAGSAFDTLLAVYEGFSYPLPPSLAEDDDRGGFLTSRVQFNAVAGAAYQIAIDGLAGQAGMFVLNWSLEITPETIPVVFVPPADQTVPAGADVTMSALAGGVPPLSFQWLRDGLPVPGATSPVLFLTNVQPEHVGDYTLEVANVFGRTVESRAASLQLGLETTAQARAKWECLLPLEESGGGGGGLQAAAAGVPSVPTLGVFARAGVPGGLTFGGIPGSGGYIQHCRGYPRAMQWVIVTNETGGDFLLFTTNNVAPTLLAVYPDRIGGIVPQQIACQATNLSDGLGSTLVFPVTVSTSYWVMIDRLNGAQAPVRLNWLLGQRPRSMNPTNIQLLITQPGASLALGAGVTNIPSPQAGYQWYRNGRPLFGQTNPVLNLPALTNRDSGHYSVRVTNALGAAESAWCLRVGTEVALDVGMTNSAGTPLAHVACGSPREFVLQAAPDLQLPTVWTNLAVKTGTNCYDYYWPVRHTNAPWQGWFRAFTTNSAMP